GARPACRRDRPPYRQGPRRRAERRRGALSRRPDRRHARWRRCGRDLAAGRGRSFDLVGSETLTFEWTMENRMKSSFARAMRRVLIALMIWTPYQFAQAGMIGTDQVVQQSTHSDRSTVMNF